MSRTGWHFDLYSALITLLVVPILVALTAIVRRNVIGAAAYTLNGIFYIVAPVLTKVAATRLTLRKYCRIHMNGQSRYVNVPAYSETSIEIDRVFVPLVLERTGFSQTCDHRGLLALGNRIQIVGDPGSGKSTIIKRLFRDECAKGVERPSAAKFPILVELRKLAIPKRVKDGDLGSWMIDYLRDDVARVAAYRVEKCFDAYVRTTGVLLLLDGLDEVNSDSFDRIQKALGALGDQFSRLGPNNHMICTMRVQFYQQIKSTLSPIFPVLLSIKRFTPTDVYTFLGLWPFAAEAQSQRMRIFKDLADRPSLREMCTNPLVLSMYVAQDQSAGGAIAPESRTEFYAKVVEELVIRRRAVQVGPPRAQIVLRNQRLEILGRVAHGHLVGTTEAANFLKWEDVIAHVTEVTGKNVDEAERYLQDLSKETGLITEEREGESWRFIHLTFCEFLAAHYAVHSSADGWRELARRHASLMVSDIPALRTRLSEAVPFACALLPRYRRHGALEAVAETNDGQILATIFLETKLYDDPLWRTFVRARERELLAVSVPDRGPGWLEGIHRFLVVCKDAERSEELLPEGSKSPALGAFFQSIAEQAGDSMFRMIASYAALDAVAAFRVATLCGLDLLKQAPSILLDSLDQPLFVALLLDQASGQASKARELACLLAESGLRSSATAATLHGVRSAIFSDICDTRISPKQRWYRPGWIRRTVFTEALSIATSTGPALAPADLEVKLMEYRKLPAPGSLRRINPAFPMLAYLAYLATSSAILLRFSVPATRDQTRDLALRFVEFPLVWPPQEPHSLIALIAVFLLSLLAAPLSLVLIFRTEAIRSVYRVLALCPGAGDPHLRGIAGILFRFFGPPGRLRLGRFDRAFLSRAVVRTVNALLESPPLRTEGN